MNPYEWIVDQRVNTITVRQRIPKSGGDGLKFGKTATRFKGKSAREKATQKAEELNKQYTWRNNVSYTSIGNKLTEVDDSKKKGLLYESKLVALYDRKNKALYLAKTSEEIILPDAKGKINTWIQNLLHELRKAKNWKNPYQCQDVFSKIESLSAEQEENLKNVLMVDGDTLNKMEWVDDSKMRTSVPV